MVFRSRRCRCRRRQLILQRKGLVTMDGLAKILIVVVLIVIAPFVVFWSLCFGLASGWYLVLAVVDTQWQELVAIGVVVVVAIKWHAHILEGKADGKKA